MQAYRPYSVPIIRSYLNPIAEKLGIVHQFFDNDQLLDRIKSVIAAIERADYQPPDVFPVTVEPGYVDWNNNPELRQDVNNVLREIANTISRRTTVTGNPSPDDYYRSINGALERLISRTRSTRTTRTPTIGFVPTPVPSARTTEKAPTARSVGQSIAARSGPQTARITRTNTRISDKIAEGEPLSKQGAEEVEEALRRSVLSPEEAVQEVERRESVINASRRTALSNKSRTTLGSVPQRSSRITRESGITRELGARRPSPSRSTYVPAAEPSSPRRSILRESDDELPPISPRSRRTVLPEDGGNIHSVSRRTLSSRATGTLTRKDYDNLIEEAAKEGNTRLILELLAEKRAYFG